MSYKEWGNCSACESSDSNWPGGVKELRRRAVRCCLLHVDKGSSPTCCVGLQQTHMLQVICTPLYDVLKG